MTLFARPKIRPLLACAAAALLVAATLGAGIWHQHEKVPGHVCQICQGLLVPLVQPQTSLACLPLVFLHWHAPAQIFELNLDPYLSSGHSRAPPA